MQLCLRVAQLPQSNQRNLADFLVTCANHPDASGELFLISDGEDVSTTELLRGISIALNKSVPLFPFPPGWLRLGLATVGSTKLASQLLGSLVIDSRKARERLGWLPPKTMIEALKEDHNL